MRDRTVRTTVAGRQGREGLVAPVRLAILNDYEVVVKGLHGMLAPFAHRVHVVELDARRPVISEVDVVLWDTFAQPGAPGDRAELMQRLRGSGARIVVFSWSTRPDVVEEVLRRGAHGYVSKHATADEVVDAIERVQRGATVRVPEAPDRARNGRDWPGRGDGLTEREAEVVGLIAHGLSNQEIANRAYLSINSVKTYIRTAYRKMEVTRRSQAVRWAIAHGFLPDHDRTVPEGEALG